MRRVYVALAAVAAVLLVFAAYVMAVAGFPGATRMEGLREAYDSLPPELPAYLLYNDTRATGIIYGVAARALGVPGNCTVVDVTMAFRVLRCGDIVVRNGSGSFEIIVPPEALNGSASDAAQRLVAAMREAFPDYNIDTFEESMGLNESVIRVMMTPSLPTCGICEGMPATGITIMVSESSGLHASFSIALPEKTLDARRPSYDEILRDISERFQGARIVVVDVKVFYRPVEQSDRLLYVPEAVISLRVYRGSIIWYSLTVEAATYGYKLAQATPP